MEMLELMEAMTNDVDHVQEKVLADILSHNAHTEYIQRHGLAGKTDWESFKTRLPIVAYEYIRPEIQRIANGDPSPVLSGLPLSHLICSSGTSGGEKKILPWVEGDEDRVDMVFGLLASIVNRACSGFKQGKALHLMHVRKETKTCGGIPVRSVVTSFSKSSRFVARQNNSATATITSPIASIHCTDMFRSMYSQLLAGLADRLSVVWLGATFALGLLQAIRFLERHYQDLTADLEQGTVNPRITDKDVRAALETRLPPDPESAAYVRNECGRGHCKKQDEIAHSMNKRKYVDVPAMVLALTGGHAGMPFKFQQ